MRLAFMGTPDFAVPTLLALLRAGHEVVRVYTQPARPAGRGKRQTMPPVAMAALAQQIRVEMPETFRGAVVEDFAGLDLDAAVVVAFGQILPQKALNAPRLGCLNLHASLLPRWRGAAPIQRAIMAGDAETGVCVMQMEAGLDTGPVLARKTMAIDPRETAGTLHDRLCGDGAALMVDTLAALEAGRATPQPQGDQGITYAAKITKAEAQIDWTRPAKELSAQIRGLSPAPGAWCAIGGERVKVLMALAENGSGPPGEALDDRLLVACGSGAVRLSMLQRAGKGPVPAEAFLNGFPITVGTKLA
ncbi:MAG: methionyl-tRNA formyltransferase [Pseudomonadota bacterium]